MFFLKNHSLRMKIAAILIIMAVLIIISMSAIFYKSVEYSESNLKETEMLGLAKETANKIDRFIFERLADIFVLTNSFVIMKDEVSDEVKLEYLDNMIKAYRIYDGIYIMNNFGEIDIWSGREILWYDGWRDVVAQGEVFISDVLEHNNNKYICIAQPVMKNGIVEGAVIEMVIFDSIEEIVRNIKIGEKGSAHLIQIKDQEEIKKVSYFTQNNERYIYALYPIKKVPGQNEQWYVMTKQPTDEAFYMVHDMIFFLVLFGFLLVVILSFISIILSKRITEPIRKLMDKMQGILNHIYEKEGYQTRNRNEILNLTESFNYLMDELEFMIEKVLVKSGEAASIDNVKKSIDRFISNIPNGIVSFDSEGNIISFNNAAEKFFNIDAENVLGRNVYNELPAELFEAGEIIKDSLTNEVEYDEHDIRILRDNTSLNLRISTMVQKNMHHAIIGLTVVVRRLQDIEELEKSILMAEKLASLGEMSAGIAHEIRNPLSSIRGYAQYALMEANTTNSIIIKDLEIIINEVDRLSELVERFLEFARPNEPDLCLCSSTDLIKETVNLCTKELTEKNIRVTASFEKNDKICMDYSQMKQVLLNLLLNAIWGINRSNGEIKITTQRIEDEKVFAIHIGDNGRGIPQEDFEKLFKPFFTKNENGKGLGLSICSRIIEKHGGVIVFDSVLGEGTIFTIKIPIETNQKEEKDERTENIDCGR